MVFYFYGCLLFVCLKEISAKQYFGPHLTANDTTTCEEFGQFARFNPDSVLDDEWMSFYYFAPAVINPMFIKFLIPTPLQVKYIKYILDGHIIHPINWTAKHVLIRERNNNTFLFVEKGDRGQYLLYELFRGLKPHVIITPREVRVKQTGDNKMIGIMICDAQVLFLFAKLKEVPKKTEIQDAAARFGFRGREGRSYLYQGHQWMPIGEAEDWEFEEAMMHLEKKRK